MSIMDYQSESGHKNIIKSQNELICRYLSDGTITFVNDACCRNFQRSRSELIGSNLFTFIPKENFKKVYSNIQRNDMRKPVTIEHRFFSNNGEVRWFQWVNTVIAYDDEENIQEFLAVGRDITGAVNTEYSLTEKEKELEKNNEKMRKLLQEKARTINELTVHLQNETEQKGTECGIDSQIGCEKRTIKKRYAVLNIIPDIIKHKAMEEKLEYTAKHDNLTNLPNWYYFQEHLEGICSSTNNINSAFLLVDLDNFNLVNDFLGRSVGDRTLVKISNCMKQHFRNDDFFARIGGDEFAAILPNTTLTKAKRIASELQFALEDCPFFAEENDISLKITVSIGITMIDGKSKMDSLLTYVRAALRKAKHDGKNRISVIEKAEDKVLIFQNNKMLSFIHDSIRRGGFVLHFQPIYSLDGNIAHYEALVRMKGESDKLIYPSSFISSAERYGFITAIDRWVIKNTFEMVTKNRNMSAFINLSGKSLGDESLLSWIESSITGYGIDSSRIGFEITETSAIRDMEKTKEWILRLKELGCSFALDDFGVGFSSFSHLYMLPIDYLKIDGSFIRDLNSDQTKYALVETMNSAAHKLGMQTIAEFVENENIWETLNRLGVDYGQGYYLGKPAPIE